MSSLDFFYANREPWKPIAQTRVWFKGTFRVAPLKSSLELDELGTGRDILEGQVGTEISLLIDYVGH